MSYITGTLTTATPAGDLYTLIAAELTATGWTLHDTVVIGGRTHRVWKSAAAGNVAGLDWYLDVAIATGNTGHIWLLPFEFFDSATDLGYRGPSYVTSSITLDATTFSRYGATGYALETNWAPVAGHTGFNKITTATTSFGYWISITRNRVIALTSLIPSSVFYVGLYESYAPSAAFAGAANFPLIIATVGPDANSSTSGGTAAAIMTRYPRISSATGGTSDMVLTLNGSLNFDEMRTGAVPAGATPITGRFEAIPVTLVPIATSPYFGTWGQLYDIAFIAAQATVVRGDTMTIDGNPWVLATYSASPGPLAVTFRAA